MSPAQLPPETKQREIIRLFFITDWSTAQVAKHLRLKPEVVEDVLINADVITQVAPKCPPHFRVNEARLLVALYLEGRPGVEVARLTGRTLTVTYNLLRAAGVMRTSKHNARLKIQRGHARKVLAKQNMESLARRWIAGAEPEGLADELGVPAYLLWDVVAERLTMTDDSTTSGETHQAKLSCVGTCPYACTKRCAQRVQVGDRAKVPGTPPTSPTRTGHREGVPYVRTGLHLPEPGRHSRW